MENKKYELIDPFTFGCIRLYSIRALRDFSDVKAGDLGGYVSGYHNLSHEGNCWIYNNAKVTGDAKVSDNARVFDNARIFNCAKVRENAKVCNGAMIYEHADVFGHTSVCGMASVHENAILYGDAIIKDVVNIHGNAAIYGHAEIMHDSIIYGHAKIYGDSKVVGYSVISDNADISSNKDCLYIKGLGSMTRSTTAFKLSDSRRVYIVCGCFYGTLDEFETRVNVAHGNNKYGKEYKALIQVIKIHFDLV